jgi:tetratricopeptide (TPR) repeat protein
MFIICKHIKIVKRRVLKSRIKNDIIPYLLIILFIIPIIIDLITIIQYKYLNYKFVDFLTTLFCIFSAFSFFLILKYYNKYGVFSLFSTHLLWIYIQILKNKLFINDWYFWLINLIIIIFIYRIILKKLNNKILVNIYSIIINIKKGNITKYKFYRGKAFYYINDFIDCIKDMTEVIDVDDKKFLAYSFRGYAEIQINEYQNAIRDFEKILKLNNNFFEAYVKLGRCYYQIANYRKAIDYLNKCIDINKYNTNEAYIFRGLSLYNFGKISDAIVDFKKIINDKNLRKYIPIEILEKIQKEPST